MLLWKFTILIFSISGLWNQVNGILEELKSTLGSAKTYLNQLTPLIADGLKAVQRFEEFIDNTIDEDCYFQCPRGKTPVPQKGHVGVTNGCGSLDVIFDNSEDSLIHVEREFSDCCDEHDLCYDVCGEDKDMCDLYFRKCLYKVCRKEDHKLFLDNKKCKLKAKLFYMAVIGVGCQPFKDAQKQACQCVKSEL